MPLHLPEKLQAGEYVLYVNYFGLVEHNIQALQQRLGSHKLIIDNSHALFDKPAGCAAVVYSPRKFAGLPDGGLLICGPEFSVSLPDEVDEMSIDRMSYLIRRQAQDAKSGYQDFNRVREQLGRESPKRMSQLTEKLLGSLDWHHIAERRRKNFNQLRAMLDPLNTVSWKTLGDSVPLIYPLVLKNRPIDDIRTALIRQNIFVPVYWPEVQARAEPGSQESTMTNQTLFLPMDQRMSSDDIEFMANEVLKLLA